MGYNEVKWGVLPQRVSTYMMFATLQDITDQHDKLTYLLKVEMKLLNDSYPWLKRMTQVEIWRIGKC